MTDNWAVSDVLGAQKSASPPNPMSATHQQQIAVGMGTLADLYTDGVQAGVRRANGRTCLSANHLIAVSAAAHTTLSNRVSCDQLR